MKAVLCFNVGKKIRWEVADAVIKLDGYLTRSVPHSVRTLLRYVTVTNDKVGTGNCPRGGGTLGFHKRAVSESRERISVAQKVVTGCEANSCNI